MSNKRSSLQPMSSINVVPYIDVMLVLLVIFMITAPLMNPGQVDLPSIGKSSTPPASPLEVIIKKDDVKPKIIQEIKPKIKIRSDESSIEFPKSISTIERLRNEALGITKLRLEKLSNVKIEEKKKSGLKISTDAITEVDFDAIKGMNVHKLRNYARNFSNFPIKGREISRANRDELVAFFKTISS